MTNKTTALLAREHPALETFVHDEHSRSMHLGQSKFAWKDPNMMLKLLKVNLTVINTFRHTGHWWQVRISLHGLTLHRAQTDFLVHLWGQTSLFVTYEYIYISISLSL